MEPPVEVPLSQVEFVECLHLLDQSLQRRSCPARFEAEFCSRVQDEGTCDPVSFVGSPRRSRNRGICNASCQAAFEGDLHDAVVDLTSAQFGKDNGCIATCVRRPYSLLPSEAYLRLLL